MPNFFVFKMPSPVLSSFSARMIIAVLSGSVSIVYKIFPLVTSVDISEFHSLRVNMCVTIMKISTRKVKSLF